MLMVDREVISTSRISVHSSEGEPVSPWWIQSTRHPEADLGREACQTLRVVPDAGPGAFDPSGLRSALGMGSPPGYLNAEHSLQAPASPP